MKKAILLFLVALATSTQAATVTWQWASTSAVKFNTTSIGANATAFLLYLGSDDLSAYTFNQLVDMTGSPETSSATRMSKVNTAVSTDSTHVGNFATVLSYKSGEDTYYNVSSTLYTITSAQVDALISEGTALPDSSFTFSNSVTTEKGKGTVGGGWAMVPEPSTAALALAGLALLLKRRKA